MDVIELTHETFHDFLKQEIIAVRLFYSADDGAVGLIIARLKDVANQFVSGITFGMINVNEQENHLICHSQQVMLTPTVFYYKYSRLEAEDVGTTNILTGLTRARIIHDFGKSLTGATFIR